MLRLFGMEDIGGGIYLEDYNIEVGSLDRPRDYKLLSGVADLYELQSLKYKYSDRMILRIIRDSVYTFLNILSEELASYCSESVVDEEDVFFLSYINDKYKFSTKDLVFEKQICIDDRLYSIYEFIKNIDRLDENYVVDGILSTKVGDVPLDERIMSELTIMTSKLDLAIQNNYFRVWKNTGYKFIDTVFSKVYNRIEKINSISFAEFDYIEDLNPIFNKTSELIDKGEIVSFTVSADWAMWCIHNHNCLMSTLLASIRRLIINGKISINVLYNGDYTTKEDLDAILSYLEIDAEFIDISTDTINSNGLFICNKETMDKSIKVIRNLDMYISSQGF